MPVPSTISDLSATASSNSPAGSDSVFPDLDNFIRAYGAFIRQLSDSLGLKANIASPTFTGQVTAPILAVDSTFQSTLSGGNPVLTFDTNDYFSYDRTNNIFKFRIGSVEKFSIDADGPQRTNDASTSNGLVRKSQMDTAVAGVTTPDASTTTKGKVELATNAETQTGTDTDRVVTPSGLAATMFGASAQGLASTSITSGVTNTNNTGRPITLVVNAITPTNNTAGSVSISINGGPAVVFASGGGVAVAQCLFSGSIQIPIGATYVLNHTATSSATYYLLS